MHFDLLLGSLSVVWFTADHVGLKRTFCIRLNGNNVQSMTELTFISFESTSFRGSVVNDLAMKESREPPAPFVEKEKV